VGVDGAKHVVHRARGAQVLLLLGCVVLAWTVQYAAGLSPKHAMTAKYLASVWPLAVFVPVFVARLFAAQRGAVLAACCALYMVASWSATRWDRLDLALDPTPVRVQRVALDSTNRLHLPRMLSRIDAGAELLVASQSLFLHDTAWPGNARRFAYLSCAASAAASRNRSSVVTALRAAYKAGPAATWGKCWNGYEFSKK
jgi:hypothetical protein